MERAAEELYPCKGYKAQKSVYASQVMICDGDTQICKVLESNGDATHGMA